MTNFSEPSEPLTCHCVNMLKVSCSLVFSVGRAIVLVFKVALLDVLLFKINVLWTGAKLVESKSKNKIYKSTSETHVSLAFFFFFFLLVQELCFYVKLA